MITAGRIRKKVLNNLQVPKDKDIPAQAVYGVVGDAVQHLRENVADLESWYTITTANGTTEYKVGQKPDSIMLIKWPADWLKDGEPEWIPHQDLVSIQQQGNSLGAVLYWSNWRDYISDTDPDTNEPYGEQLMIGFSDHNATGAVDVDIRCKESYYEEFSDDTDVIHVPQSVERVLQMLATEYMATIYRKDEVSYWHGLYELALSDWRERHAITQYAGVHRSRFEVRKW